MQFDNPLYINSGGTLQQFGAIVGAAANFVKDGSGTAMLSGDNTYTKGTYVKAGTLIVTNNETIEDGTSLYVGSDLGAFGSVVPALAGQEFASPATAPVPEPGTLALLAAVRAVGALAAWRRRQSPVYGDRP